MAQGTQSTAAAFALPAADGEREFAFSDADFRGLAQVAYEQAGISLADSKRNLVYSRLSRRLRALGLGTFREYREFLDQNIAERESFINAISTNLTKFFRESHHFDHLRSEVVGKFAKANAGKSGRLRVWSAGCSSGEEPYTIAVVIKKEIRDLERHDIRILATDIDTEVLGRGSRGEYPGNSVDDIPRNYQEYFQPVDGKSDTLAVDRQARSLVAFKRLNLMEQWPFKGSFDAIFCRNVMIYFDEESRAKVVKQLVRHLLPGGYLFVGYSESLGGLAHGLEAVSHGVYRRP